MPWVLEQSSCSIVQVFVTKQSSILDSSLFATIKTATHSQSNFVFSSFQVKFQRSLQVSCNMAKRALDFAESEGSICSKMKMEFPDPSSIVVSPESIKCPDLHATVEALIVSVSPVRQSTTLIVN